MQTFTGAVMRGAGRGHELGFPTINIRLKSVELTGIFAAWVAADGKRYPAAAFVDPTRELLEAHLLDFEGDLYAKTVSITLVEKIRDSERFDDEGELRRAIAADVARVRQKLMRKDL